MTGFCFKPENYKLNKNVLITENTENRQKKCAMQ